MSRGRRARGPARGRGRSRATRLAVVLGLALAAGAAPAAAATCARRPVPSWQSVAGAPLGARPATDEQIGAYLAAVDRAGDRVRTGVMGTSVQGRPLPYALVSDPANLAPARLAAIEARLRALRDGDPRASTAGLPAVVWLAAGVHANEPSGADADMAVLRELAAGERCDELRRLLVVIAPLQNPDGRAAGTRTNADGFDLNRDWFAMTQPETRAKVALMRRLPPVALADQHEQDGASFFFPPNADPIHHEIPRGALDAIDGVFGPALRRAFRAHRRPFEDGTTFDLFFMGYGDTVPTTLFGAAGMTFEKGGAAPYAQRVADHALAARTLLATAAAHRDALLAAWARGWRRARAQGARGELQPNLVVRPGDRVEFRVPARPVHAYLLRADVHGADAAALVARLHAVGVRAGRLRRTVRLPAFRPYGSARPRAATLPAGTWVVPMAQAQKHWVEAMLGQDAYVPFPYFYDVSSWSRPLLMGVAGGWSELPLPPGAVGFGAPGPAAAGPAAAPAYAFAGDSAGGLGLALDLLARGATVERRPVTGEVFASGVDRGGLARLARARRVDVRPATAPPAGAVALRPPRVALLADLAPVVTGIPGHENSALHDSHGWTRFVLERRLGLAVDELSGADLAAGALAAHRDTALVVADGQLPRGALSAAALARIQAFVRDGGTYVGVRALGLDVARAAGITSVSRRPTPAGFQVPGATFAVAIDGRDPLGWGAGGPGFQFDASDPILAPGGGTPVVRYPAGGGFVSGYAAGAGALRGTPALVDAAFGAGRVALFAFDPSFRAYVEGDQRLLANALLAPPPGGAAARAAAARAAPRPPVHPPHATAGERPPDVVVRVAAADAPALRAAPLPPGARLRAGADGLTLEAPNPAGAPGEDLPWLRDVLASLARAGTRPTLIIA